MRFFFFFIGDNVMATSIFMYIEVLPGVLRVWNIVLFYLPLLFQRTFAWKIENNDLLKISERIKNIYRKGSLPPRASRHIV